MKWAWAPFNANPHVKAIGKVGEAKAILAVHVQKGRDVELLLCSIAPPAGPGRIGISGGERVGNVLTKRIGDLC
jgi:hypothetical protein